MTLKSTRVTVFMKYGKEHKEQLKVNIKLDKKKNFKLSPTFTSIPNFL